MSKENSMKTILVTGATGFIASWIVKYLLEEGHTVHATIRDKSKKEKYQHLLDIDAKSAGTLKIFDADLTKPGSFNEAAKGCEIVMHTASPFLVQGIKNPEEQLIRPAKEGTSNVLDAVNKAGVAKRVVLTSSVAAIYSDNDDLRKKANNAFTEADWNETSTLKHNAYSYSKTLAEKEAWKMVKEQTNWTLTTINPGFVLGPSLTTRKDSASISTMIQMADGSFKMGAPDLYFGMVDVRDVAQAHIRAGLNQQASGRHIMVADTKSFLDVANILRSEFGDSFPFPKGKIPTIMLYMAGPFMGFSWKYIKKNVGIPLNFDNSYSKKDLGIEFRDLKQTFIDQFNQLLKDGLIKKN